MNSYALHEAHYCPDCGFKIQFALWQFIDIQERPLLYERLKANNLHVIYCPNCQYEFQFDVAVVLYAPTQNPPLIYASNRQHKQTLPLPVNHIKQVLGRRWSDAMWREVCRNPQTPICVEENRTTYPTHLLQYGTAHLKNRRSLIHRFDDSCLSGLDQSDLYWVKHPDELSQNSSNIYLLQRWLNRSDLDSYLRALLLATLGDSLAENEPVEAHSCFEDSLLLLHPDWHPFEWAYIYKRLGDVNPDPVISRDCYREAISLFSAEEYWLDLALTRLAMGDLLAGSERQTAREYYQQAMIILNPDDYPEIGYHLQKTITALY